MKRLRQLLWLKEYRIRFERHEQNFTTLFDNKLIVEQFEVFLSNQIIDAINKKQYEKAQSIDAILWVFLATKKEYYKNIDETAELPAWEQIREIQKTVLPTQI